MRVSVIVPLFNKSATIERTIRSIQSQTFTDFELIVVDDGSTDDGSERAQRVLDSRGRLIRQKNSGPGAARNAGVRHSTGDLLAFLDGDDEWLPEFLEESVRAVTQVDSPLAATVSGYLQYPEGISTEKMWRSRGLTEGLFTVDTSTSAKLLVSLLAYLSPCTTVMRREVFESSGGFYEDRCRYGEDAYLMLKVILSSSICVSLTPRVIYHRENSQLTVTEGQARPIEPFLLHPDRYIEQCPVHLRELAFRVLTLRAYKTACVLGYWSQSQTARQVLRPFLSWRIPFSWYLIPALLAATPLADGIGAFLRALRGALLKRTK